MRVPFCFLPDLTRVKSGSACLPPGRVTQGAPARAGAAEFTGRLDRPSPPFPAPWVNPGVAFGKSDRSICHWQIAQAVLWLPFFAVGEGDDRRLFLCSYASATPFILFWFLPDLSRVKFGGARLP